MSTTILSALGLKKTNSGSNHPHGKLFNSFNPATGKALAQVKAATVADYRQTVRAAQAAWPAWRDLPAPQRGEVVRQLGEVFRQHKQALGALVSLESGKILSEGLGEVQEVIDICDFAVGLSRQLYGFTMHSERPGHRMYEQWHPLGVVGVITAFNFPVAVWAWNAMLALVCGNTVVWKPSEKTPLAAVAAKRLAAEVLRANGHPDVLQLAISADASLGKAMAADPAIALVSATGSTAMGRSVGQVVAQRFGKSLLELGGNNAIIVWEDADLELATRAIVFGACGTAGQRCTTTRRLLVHPKVLPALTARLVKAYDSLTIGDPLKPGVLVGPLIDAATVQGMQTALGAAIQQGGALLTGGEVLPRPGHFVRPALVQVKAPIPQMQHEVFAPILYICPVTSVEQAIAYNNAVPQGLSSAIFTQNLKVAEQFLSAAGSDCGIANVNIGTSGAEIGGAFGGEKETGGGRESGSTAWQAYMRRQTCTINYSNHLPLAQGVKFS